MLSILRLTIVVSAAFLVAGCFRNEPVQQDWPAYLGNNSRTQYSTLKQINKQNVAQLQHAWTFDTGDVGDFQANSIIVGGVLYTASPARLVLALNAATGAEIWRFNPSDERKGLFAIRQRGVVHWQDGNDRRIFTSAGGWLYALRADTGEVIRSFGENGSIAVNLNTPGVIYQDLLIVGMLVGENTPGGIRAYDVRTGALKWHFNTIPHPGEYGYDTWPADAFKTVGGASDWSGQSLDEERGIVYASTETAGPDFYGAKRHGSNLFANSIIALNASTGERLWHFQIVHHDLNDKDLPTPPELITVTHNGRRIDAVAQGTKHGLLFVFDRVTGEPLWPIEEKPVPRSTLPGEQSWPTQPIPTKPPPLMRQRYTLDDISQISPEANALTLERFNRAGSEGLFPVPGLSETILFPGFDGGFEWGGSAVDPDGILYTNINEVPWILQLVETRHQDGAKISINEMAYRALCASCHGMDRKGNPPAGVPSLIEVAATRTRDEVMEIVLQGGGRMPGFGLRPEQQRNAAVDFLFGVETEVTTTAAPDDTDEVPYVFTGWRRWLDQEGYPAIKPPWGTLNAIDLNKGEILWKIRLGEYPALTAKGVPPTGTETYGGPVATAGGLLFIGATADEMFRAFDKDTGKVLWQAKLPFGGFATPSTYMVDGKQYVVISAGGEKANTPAGGSIVAFALPD